MAASLCGPVSQSLRRMHSACCKYSFPPRASRGHSCPRSCGVLPPASWPAQRQTAAGPAGEEQPTSQRSWCPWLGRGAGTGWEQGQAQQNHGLFCAAHAAPAPRSKGENNQRYCRCALRKCNLLASWSRLTTWGRYLHLTTRVLSLVTPQALVLLWSSVRLTHLLV